MKIDMNREQENTKDIHRLIATSLFVTIIFAGGLYWLSFRPKPLYEESNPKNHAMI
jgi:hypothetical protein